MRCSSLFIVAHGFRVHLVTCNRQLRSSRFGSLRGGGGLPRALADPGLHLPGKRASEFQGVRVWFDPRRMGDISFLRYGKGFLAPLIDGLASKESAGLVPCWEPGAFQEAQEGSPGCPVHLKTARPLRSDMKPTMFESSQFSACSVALFGWAPTPLKRSTQNRFLI